MERGPEGLVDVLEALQASIVNHLCGRAPCSLHVLDDRLVNCAWCASWGQLHDPLLMNQGLQATLLAQALLLQPASQPHGPLSGSILHLNFKNSSTQLDVNLPLLLETGASLEWKQKTPFMFLTII